MMVRSPLGAAAVYHRAHWLPAGRVLIADISPAQDPMNNVDLVAFLPFWITLIVEGKLASEKSGSSFGFVRVIRLVRVFRVFKFGRYSVGIQMFVGAIVKSRQPLGVLLFMILISTTMIASIMCACDARSGNARGGWKRVRTGG